MSVEKKQALRYEGLAFFSADQHPAGLPIEPWVLFEIRAQP
jgi:hypothetical protein